MGLATIALMEGVRKSRKYGAKYCFGGQREFYGIIGFENVGKRIMWKKTCEANSLQVKGKVVIGVEVVRHGFLTTS